MNLAKELMLEIYTNDQAQKVLYQQALEKKGKEIDKLNEEVERLRDEKQLATTQPLEPARYVSVGTSTSRVSQTPLTTDETTTELQGLHLKRDQQSAHTTSGSAERKALTEKLSIALEENKKRLQEMEALHGELAAARTELKVARSELGRWKERVLRARGPVHMACRLRPVEEDSAPPTLDPSHEETHAPQDHYRCGAVQVSSGVVSISTAKQGNTDKVSSVQFDEVMGPDVTNEQLSHRYNDLAYSALHNARQNSLITYGQSGSGKTYSLVGNFPAPSVADGIVNDGAQQRHECGLICHIAAWLAAEARAMSSQSSNGPSLDVVPVLSAVESYDNRLTDLLSGTEDTKSTTKGKARADVVSGLKIQRKHGSRPTLLEVYEQERQGQTDLEEYVSLPGEQGKCTFTPLLDIANEESASPLDSEGLRRRICELIGFISRRRRTAETKTNETSSRSFLFLLFSFIVRTRGQLPAPPPRRGSLLVVDLAGSEHAGVAEKQSESNNINLSLFYFGKLLECNHKRQLLKLRVMLEGGPRRSEAEEKLQKLDSNLKLIAKEGGVSFSFPPEILAPAPQCLTTTGMPFPCTIQRLPCSLPASVSSVSSSIP